MSTDIYTRLMALLPQQPIVTGAISAVHADGTATVTLTSGTTARCRNPFGIAASSACYVQGGEIIGEAPLLTPVSIDI